MSLTKKKKSAFNIFNAIFNPAYEMNERDRKIYYRYLVDNNINNSSSFSFDSILTILFGAVTVILVGLVMSNFLTGKTPTRSKMQSEIVILQNELKEVKDSQKLSTSSGYTNEQLSSKVIMLEDNYKNLSNTILYDVDKAVTSKILYSEQRNLELQNSNLRDDFKRLEERVYGLIISVVGVPLFGMLISMGINAYRKKMIVEEIDSRRRGK